jgi:hypothetical protein
MVTFDSAALEYDAFDAATHDYIGSFKTYGQAHAAVGKAKLRRRVWGPFN